MDNKERLRQIKQQQVNARNPGESKIRGYDWGKHDHKAQRIAVQKRKKQQRFILFEIWEILPGRWKGVVYGVLFGAVMSIPLLFVLPSNWHFMVLLPLLICGIVGMILGKTLQDDGL